MVYWCIASGRKGISMKVLTNNFEETQNLGEEFAQKIQPGDALLLFGNLGTGKTTFLQGLAKGLGIQRRIISPTFIIVRKYSIDKQIKHFYHIDLYRTHTEDDLKGLGIPEILEEKDAIVAIEWPEKLYTLTPKRGWELYFKTIDENIRSITIEKSIRPIQEIQGK